MKNSILKDALILFAITLIAGFGLGFVYNLTKDPIAAKREEKVLKANQAIFPAAASFDEVEDYEDKMADYKIYRGAAATLLTGNVTINDALAAKSSDGQLLGYIVSATSADGYGGDITISLGVDIDGKVTGLEFTEINETVGFGASAVEPEFKGQFVDKKVIEFKYTKNDVSADNEIKAISGATKTTKAVTEAVNIALDFAKHGLLK